MKMIIRVSVILFVLMLCGAPISSGQTITSNKRIGIIIEVGRGLFPEYPNRCLANASFLAQVRDLKKGDLVMVRIQNNDGSNTFTIVRIGDRMADFSWSTSKLGLFVRNNNLVCLMGKVFKTLEKDDAGISVEGFGLPEDIKRQILPALIPSVGKSMVPYIPAGPDVVLTALFYPFGALKKGECITYVDYKRDIFISHYLAINWPDGTWTARGSNNKGFGGVWDACPVSSKNFVGRILVLWDVDSNIPDSDLLVVN
ncbi:MAG: hypothetical protein COV01_03130 [Candidatus Taylorbacteria bacterium CG10_big_fil_rev_8_21_14_0_10_41_48]|uniref:Uncharacterized protein n=1 Tax=Candidatus Taylorbacteria bacterium CG10_big_fil_rev_8_21_14_0_10_41_48 TaxID=1975024 RepID=A0A2M8LBR4_9BACT|nr:MAG: hypothetical protein COV01_03130 [Candidatus Taylorbacteria bacterium CG10_big_fil_rev_8_21_14_0_10_41_48]